MAMDENGHPKGECYSQYGIPGGPESSVSSEGDPGTIPPSVGASPGRSSCWQPLAGTSLLDRLRSTGRARPSFHPTLASDLRAFVERGVEGFASSSATDHAPSVTRERLTRALACPLHRMPDRSTDRSFSLSLARGALMDALFRQVVTTGTIGDASADGLEALSLDEFQVPLVAWIGQLSPAERSELRCEIERQSDGLLRRWPALDPAWLPRTRETLRAPLAGGRVDLVARVDLAIGRPSRSEASVALVETTSGERRQSHRHDRHFDALVETLRRGVPPFVVATYFSSSGEIDVDPVTPELLIGAARRCVVGTQAMVASGIGRIRDPGDEPFCAGCAGELSVVTAPTPGSTTVSPVVAARPPVDEGILPFPRERAA